MWGNSVSFWSSIANLFLIYRVLFGYYCCYSFIYVTLLFPEKLTHRIRKETELETTKLKSVTERARAEAALANERARFT